VHVITNPKRNLLPIAIPYNHCQSTGTAISAERGGEGCHHVPWSHLYQKSCVFLKGRESTIWYALAVGIWLCLCLQSALIIHSSPFNSVQWAFNSVHSELQERSGNHLNEAWSVSSDKYSRQNSYYVKYAVMYKVRSIGFQHPVATRLWGEFTSFICLSQRR